jgi:hypothetical protein
MRAPAKAQLSSSLNAIKIVRDLLHTPDATVFELREFGQAPRNRVLANSPELMVTEIINRVQQRDLLLLTARRFDGVGQADEQSVMIDPDVVTFALAAEHLVLNPK